MHKQATKLCKGTTEFIQRQHEERVLLQSELIACNESMQVLHATMQEMVPKSELLLSQSDGDLLRIEAADFKRKSDLQVEAFQATIDKLEGKLAAMEIKIQVNLNCRPFADHALRLT